jgi:hypothetical protein
MRAFFGMNKRDQTALIMSKETTVLSRIPVKQNHHALIAMASFILPLPL